MRISRASHNARFPENYVIEFKPGVNYRIFDCHVIQLARTQYCYSLGSDTNFIEKNQVIIFGTNTPRKVFSNGGEYGFDWARIKIHPQDGFEALGLPINRPFNIDNPLLVSGIFKEIAFELTRNGKHRGKTINVLGHWLLYKISESAEQALPPPTPYIEQLSHIRSEIYNSPERNISVEQAAQSLNICVSHFQHLYRAAFECSYKDDVIQSRIERAKDALLDGHCSVFDVSQLCGYSQVFYFSRQFKERTGLSPLQYKKKFS